LSRATVGVAAIAPAAILARTANYDIVAGSAGQDPGTAIARGTTARCCGATGSARRAVGISAISSGDGPVKGLSAVSARTVMSFSTADFVVALLSVEAARATVAARASTGRCCTAGPPGTSAARVSTAPAGCRSTVCISAGSAVAVVARATHDHIAPGPSVQASRTTIARGAAPRGCIATAATAVDVAVTATTGGCRAAEAAPSCSAVAIVAEAAQDRVVSRSAIQAT
jgi:hypothetical protein